jgi:hypothetical protein
VRLPDKYSKPESCHQGTKPLRAKRTGCPFAAPCQMGPYGATRSDGALGTSDASAPRDCPHLVPVGTMPCFHDRWDLARAPLMPLVCSHTANCNPVSGNSRRSRDSVGRCASHCSSETGIRGQQMTVDPDRNHGQSPIRRRGQEMKSRESQRPRRFEFTSYCKPNPADRRISILVSGSGSIARSPKTPVPIPAFR